MDSSRPERETFVEALGDVIYLKRWAPASLSDPTPLFLLHDSLGCVELWRDFPRLLCDGLGRHVIAYDRPGYGRSSARTEPPSSGFILEEAEITFPAVLRALGVSRFDLFGHSVGGVMAIAIAARISGCRTVVTESAQAFVEPRTVAGVSKAKEEFEDPARFGRLVRYHGSKARWVLRAWTDTWLSPAFADWSLAPLLAEVRCPVLAIHGETDEYGSKAFPETICRLAGGESSMRIVPGCGHVPHRENPGAVLDCLREFHRKR